MYVYTQSHEKHRSFFKVVTTLTKWAEKNTHWQIYGNFSSHTEEVDLDYLALKADEGGAKRS